MTNRSETATIIFYAIAGYGIVFLVALIASLVYPETPITIEGVERTSSLRRLSVGAGLFAGSLTLAIVCLVAAIGTGVVFIWREFPLGEEQASRFSRRSFSLAVVFSLSAFLWL